MFPDVSQVICPHCGSTDVKNYGGMCVCFTCRASFPAPKEPKPFHPMRLFISYGHPESEICQRIYAALKERHHHVWFDDTNMAHGEDWREQITEGIVHSDGVISCLSKHSVRDPGVSLDELSIAIGVRGGNIKTILLESEKEVQPPASVCHIQWLDMSQWREMLNQGDEVFELWFKAKMDQLFEVIESEESREFVGQINAIRDKLHVNYDTSKQKDLLRRAFVGRQWLADQVEAWLDDPAGARLCVLYGDPGVGKSAFAARYMHYNPRVAAGLFCEYSRPLYNDPRTVIMTLAYLLACRLPNYRVVLSEILEQEKRLGEMNPSELFDLLLATPLTSLVIDGGQEALCIVIDGLDECAQGERNALAEVLGQYTERLPAWLRILATARDISAVTGPLGEAFRMELRGEQEQNREDVRQYFIEQLQDKHGGDPVWPAALDTLTERSGGIFLYAALVANGIRNGKVSIADSERFPEGLSDAFHQWFGWFFPDDEAYKREFRAPLGAILAAPEALPARELKRIFGWDDNEQNDFLQRIEVLLKRDVNDFGDETVAFSHQYLNEWLDTPKAGRFRSSRRAALEKMTERFYELFREDKDAVTYYEAVHMLRLQEMCGQADRRDELASDPDLFQAVIDAGDYCREWGKLDMALRCYEQARDMVETETVLDAAERQGDLSVSYSRVAGILKAKDQLDEALALYEEALAICERLVQEQDTPEYQRNLSISYHKVADILETQGQWNRALALYAESLEIDERLVREQDTPRNCRDLSISYERVAGNLEARDQLDEALAWYKKGLALRERLVQEQDTPRHRLDLSVSYVRVAGIMQAKGRMDEALALYEKSMAIDERLARGLDTPGSRRDLGKSYYRVTGILEAKGKLNEALVLYQKSIEIFERLVWEQHTSTDRRDLSVGYKNMASILEAQGQFDEALALYKKDMALLGQLLRKKGEVSDYKNMALSCYKMASTVTDRIEKIAYAKRGLAIFKMLLGATCNEDYHSFVVFLQGILDESQPEERAAAHRLRMTALRFAVNKKRVVQAYCLGAGSPMEKQLIQEGAISPLPDGQYELYSQEACLGIGELAREGDYFKIDTVDGKHYPYLNKRDFFLAHHTHMEGDTYLQESVPIGVWVVGDWLCEEMCFLLNSGRLAIDPWSRDYYFNASLFDAPLSAARDAVIGIYDVSRDETGAIMDVEFNFITRQYFEENYEYVHSSPQAGG